MKELATLQDSTNSKVVVIESATPEKLISRFFEFLDVSNATNGTYRKGIRQFMKFIKTENISKPTRETVLSFKRSLIERGLKPSTVALYLSSIRRFFSWCESESLYPNITNGIKSPKQQAGHKRDFLSGVQIQSMLQKATTKRDKAMIMLIATCGLRTIEVVRADIGDIHNVGGVMVLDIQGKGHASKDAFVKLSEPVMKAIQEYLSERGNVKVNEPLFVSESRRNKGQRLTTRTISGICKNAMKKAGYDSPRLSAHSLRHSAATLSLLAGMDITEVSAFMRHSSIGITMIYAHHVNRLKSMCESAVTSAIFGNGRLSA